MRVTCWGNIRILTLKGKPSTSLIAGGEPIILPEIVQPYEEHLPDYEVELAIVIGKAAKNVSEADALDYVLGYTGANDVSVYGASRDYDRPL